MAIEKVSGEAVGLLPMAMLLFFVLIFLSKWCKKDSVCQERMEVGKRETFLVYIVLKKSSKLL